MYEGQGLHMGCDRLDLLAFSHAIRKTELQDCSGQTKLEQNSWAGLHGPHCSQSMVLRGH